MIAFISSTPYQTWNSIVMAKKLFPNEACDLFVLDHCENYKKIAYLVENEKIFANVYTCEVLNLFCNQIKNKFIRRTKKFLYFLFWKTYLKKHAPINQSYSKVFISSNDEIRCFMLTKMREINPNIEAFYFEDGAGDYLNDFHPKWTGKKAKLAKMVGLNFGLGDEIKKSYVLSPTCVACRDFEYLPIPKINKTEDREIIEILNRVFHYKPYHIEEMIIYLFNNLPSIYNDIERTICEIASKCGNENIILKDHPRLPATGYDDIKRIPSQNETMWEIMCANIDFSNKILISHCSTALYTPKFIFDQEPIVIFLFDMLVDDVLQSLNQMHAFEIFVDRLKETYRDKEKVFLPKSKEELLEYLEKVLSKNE